MRPGQPDFVEPQRNWTSALSGGRILSTAGQAPGTCVRRRPAPSAASEETRLAARISSKAAVVPRAIAAVPETCALGVKGLGKAADRLHLRPGRSPLMVSCVFRCCCGRATHLLAAMTQRSTPGVGQSDSWLWGLSPSAGRISDDREATARLFTLRLRMHPQAVTAVSTMLLMPFVAQPISAAAGARVTK